MRAYRRVCECVRVCGVLHVRGDAGRLGVEAGWRVLTVDGLTVVEDCAATDAARILEAGIGRYVCLLVLLPCVPHRAICASFCCKRLIRIP